MSMAAFLASLQCIAVIRRQRLIHRMARANPDIHRCWVGKLCP